MKILWIPHAGWHIPQRAHLFCRALAERHEVHVTDWATDFSTPGDYLSPRYLRNFTYRRYMDGKIAVHGIPRISPALYVPALRHLNTRIFSHYVQAIIDRQGIDAVVGTFVVPPPRARRLIFDLFDDNIAYWRDYRHNPTYAKEIELCENNYLKKADYVVSVSSVLADISAKKLNGNYAKVRHIPNGVDLGGYQRANGEPLRSQLSIEGHKVIGFIASFGEFSGLLRLIEAFRKLDDPKTMLLIVGDGQQSIPARCLAEKYRLKNILFTGRIPNKDIPAYYKLLDIGIIPFDKNPFTDSACPIKLLEYLATGIPVVSTDLEEVRRMNFPNVILVEEDAAAMAEGIKAAFQLPRGRPPQIESYDIHRLVDQFECVLIH